MKWPGALRISTGVRKGQPYCPRGPAAGFTHAATCPSLLCVNAAAGVTVLAPHHLNPRTPTLSPVHRRPLAHTLERDEANAQTCGIPKRMGGWALDLAPDPPPSNSYHTEQIKESRCYQPTLSSHFPLQRTLSQPQFCTSRGLFGREKGPRHGERVNCRFGGHAEREAGSQKSLKDEKLAFQVDS